MTRQHTNRRGFLKRSTQLAIAGGLMEATRKQLWAKAAVKRLSGLRVAKVERTTVRIPYRETPRRSMERELPHWRYAELCQVHLANGEVGVGETLLYYTWEAPTDESVKRVIGKHAAEMMWDDTLGAGLQMGLFDAVAKWMEVPIHKLLGEQVYEKTPLSWWNIDTSAADMVSECLEAKRLGYTSYKTKGRPWFDVREQAAAVSKALPKDFHLDIDFNATLLDAKRGIPILKDLEQFPQVDIYEEPIPQTDIAGNQQVRKATRVGIAHHYGRPEPLVALKEEICDGFLIGKGATECMAAGRTLEITDKPFWLQLVGTGVTAAWSLHFGGIFKNATWPAVNCHQLFEHQLLTQPIQVKNGFAAVPEKPGLGFDIDWKAVDKYRVEKPAQRPDPPRLLKTTWKNGRVMYVSNNGDVNFMLTLGQLGKMPYYETGANTVLVPNDGTKSWQQTYDRATKGPYFAE